MGTISSDLTYFPDPMIVLYELATVSRVLVFEVGPEIAVRY